jgi:hypothetical protein
MAQQGKRLAAEGKRGCESHALTEFRFCGLRGQEMGKNFKDYDLAIDDGERLHRVSVKGLRHGRGRVQRRGLLGDRRCEYL